MAKNYLFRLESVLNHRLIIEEEKKKEFSLALNLLKIEEDKVAKIESEILSKMKEFAAVQTKGFHSSEFFEYQNYLKRLKLNKDSQYKKITKLKANLEEKRNKLVEATKNRKAIEKLKESDKRQFLLNQERLEQVFLDEITILRFNNSENERGEY